MKTERMAVVNFNSLANAPSGELERLPDADPHAAALLEFRVSAKLEQEQVERAMIAQVARASGRIALEEDDANQWPDGWLVAGARRLPVEVVQAFFLRPDENPQAGSAYQRHAVNARREARDLVDKSGQPVSTATTPEGYTVLDGDVRAPVDLLPTRMDVWIIAAIQQKLDKLSGPTSAPLVLVVEVRHVLEVSSLDIARIVDAIEKLDGPFPFAEVWIVNDFIDRPLRVPLPAR